MALPPRSCWRARLPDLKSLPHRRAALDKTITGASLTNVKALGRRTCCGGEKHATQLAEYTAQYAKVFEDADVENMTPAIGGGPAKALAEDDYKDFGKAAPAFSMIRTGGALAGFNDLPVPSPSLPVPGAGAYDGTAHTGFGVVVGQAGVIRSSFAAMALERH